jgi:hypothetical protein
MGKNPEPSFWNKGHVGRLAVDNRLFVEAVLYCYCVGELPEGYGD